MGMMVFTCWGLMVMIGMVLLAFKGASHLACIINWEIVGINSKPLMIAVSTHLE
jgi:hypothetical protein